MTWKDIIKDSTLENTRGEPVDYSPEAMEARRKHGLAGVERKNKIIEQLRRKKEKGPLTQIEQIHLRELENDTMHELVRDAYLQGKNPDEEWERKRKKTKGEIEYLERERKRKDILKEDEVAFPDDPDTDEVLSIASDFYGKRIRRTNRNDLLSSIRQKNKLLGGTKELDELERRLLKVMEK